MLTVELMNEVTNISNNCSVCKEYTRPRPRPAVGLPHAVKFNETVGIDLKFFDGKIILHMIDHLSRFSSAVFIKSKRAEDVIEGIVGSWIAIFGTPNKFLIDNGGEFANKKFMELAESFNIRIMTTAAFSPWSNGIVERHNGILSEMLHKIVADGKNPTSALAWAIQAKNSLTNVHGFSPAQIALGQNPQLPNVLVDKLPALDERDCSEVVMEQLNNMRAARKAYIEAEHSSRLKRAMVHNVRSSSGEFFFYW